ncbi:MAG TPA: glyoxalase superfamily protein [Ignavibacteria bacterium]|nr:glyoxalase superfamily protein [Ignavibacteria bacterium]HRF66986.1 glyoxalase superfamily protein [Ignavibacteria bacterium]HRJ04798.1 glyoxalase superfamily protein [Ignavibacteria bacterium]
MFNNMEMKLELVIVPVSDVDRAKSFYADKVGFNADHDHTIKPGLRFVQLTPPGSGCSIAVGEGLTEMEPGSLKGLQMVVKDAEAARELLVTNGVNASEVEVFPWGSFTYFSDPDGNTWSVQQLPPKP